jgi:hypothetical protein
MEKCLKTGNGSGFLAGNQLFFQNFQGFTRFVAKSLKFTRFFTPKPEIQGFYCVFK